VDSTDAPAAHGAEPRTDQVARRDPGQLEVSAVRRILGPLTSVSLALPLLGVLTVGGVSAGRADTDTITIQGVTDTFPDVNPCTGDPVTITVTYNSVSHVTTLPSGDIHLTSMFTGDVVLVPVDPALPTYTGHVVDWSTQIYNRNEALATFTTRARVTGSDGSTLRLGIVAHVTADTVDVSTDPPTTTGLKVTFLQFSCAS
jgi:hypothetical protein